MLAVHGIAALLALVCGLVALFVAKGGLLHRRSGTIFVQAMLVMSATGTAMAVVKAQALNAVTGGMVLYLVTTAWFTVRPARRAGRHLTTAALLIASALAGTAFLSGLDAMRHEMPFFPMLFVFAAVAGLAAWGDWRLLTRGIGGNPRRLARHLWRMGLALMLATMAVPRVLPGTLRLSGWAAAPAGLVALVVLYWLARVFIRQRAIAGALSGQMLRGTEPLCSPDYSTDRTGN